MAQSKIGDSRPTRGVVLGCKCGAVLRLDNPITDAATVRRLWALSHTGGNHEPCDPAEARAAARARRRADTAEGC